jgi:Tol biopolymer transport system component
MHKRPAIGVALGAFGVLAALTASVSVLIPSARAVFPGRNGRITFMRTDPAGLWQIWVASGHFRNRTKLTDKSANSGWPVWAPGGRRIAFDSDRADPSPNDSNAINDIFTMRPDGTGVCKLTHSRGFSSDAGYAPNGKHIAFDSDRDYPDGREAIYVMRRDGTHVRRITKLPDKAKLDLAPRFSPNGKWLVFTRYLGFGNTAPSALFRVRRDGTHLQRLTSYSIRAGDGDWSPNGRKLTFEAYPNEALFGNVYVIDANGRHLENLTHHTTTVVDNTIVSADGGSADPVWSPNGRKILFLEAQVLRDHRFKNGLATMRPDGSKRAFLSQNPKDYGTRPPWREVRRGQHQPDWESIP